MTEGLTRDEAEDQDAAGCLPPDGEHLMRANRKWGPVEIWARGAWTSARLWLWAAWRMMRAKREEMRR